MATDITCGANFVGNNVECLPAFLQYHTYLKNFINWFVNSTLLTLRDKMFRPVTDIELLNTKKDIFRLCSKGEMYAAFSQYMLATATKVMVDIGGGQFVQLSIYDVGTPGAMMLTTSAGPVENKIVNLFVMGASMHLMGLKGWASDFDFGSLEAAIVPIFPINPIIIQEYDIKVKEIKMRERQLSLMASTPAVRLEVAAASTGLKHVTNPLHELLLRASNYFSLGPNTGDIRTDLSMSRGSTLNYTANTVAQSPPDPLVSRLPQGTMIWNSGQQLQSTIIYLSIYQSDSHDVAMLLLPAHQMGRIMELYIFDITNKNNYQHWNITGVTGSAENYVEYNVNLAGSNGWVAANGDECEVVVLRAGQTLPSSSGDLSRKFHSLMGGGVKKQNKSKRRKQKRSNKKKSRHYNRNNRKRFY